MLTEPIWHGVLTIRQAPFPHPRTAPVMGIRSRRRFWNTQGIVIPIGRNTEKLSTLSLSQTSQIFRENTPKYRFIQIIRENINSLVGLFHRKVLWSPRDGCLHEQRRAACFSLRPTRCCLTGWPGKGALAGREKGFLGRVNGENQQ